MAISDIERLLAYYRAGGGQRDSTQEIFEGINNIGNTLLDARRRSVENQKMQLENAIKRKELDQGKSLNLLLGIPQQAQTYENNRQMANNQAFAGVTPSNEAAGMFQAGLENGVVTSKPTIAPPKTAGQMFQQQTGLPEQYGNLSPDMAYKVAQAKAMEALTGQRQAQTAMAGQFLNPATGEISQSPQEGFVRANSGQIIKYFKDKNGSAPAAFLDLNGNLHSEPVANSSPISSKELVTVVASKKRNGGDLDFTEKQLVLNAAKQLPELRKTASTAVTGLGNISRMEQMINTSNVTGKGGQFKAFIAPYAEAIGVDSKSLSDAQAFQLLARVAVGPQRLQLIGPGAVTEYEQQLLNKLSGGGGATKEAALELMNYYKNMNVNSINEYNETLSGISSISPNSSVLYKPINYSLPSASQSSGPRNKPIVPPSANPGSPKQGTKSADDILKKYGI